MEQLTTFANWQINLLNICFQVFTRILRCQLRFIDEKIHFPIAVLSSDTVDVLTCIYQNTDENFGIFEINFAGFLIIFNSF